MALLHDTETRSTPAKVYPASEHAEEWIVEPPTIGVSAIVEIKTFTGHAALCKALEYAHYTYGSTLYLSVPLIGPATRKRSNWGKLSSGSYF